MSWSTAAFPAAGVGDSGAADDYATAAITTNGSAIKAMNLIPPGFKIGALFSARPNTARHLACRAISD